MSKDFLYCEETDTKIFSNDVVSISIYPDTKWIAKQGWYKLGSAQKNGWYFVSITDKTILPIDLVDIKDVVKDPTRAVSDEGHSSVPETTSEVTTTSEYLEVSDAKVFNNDTVIISSHPDTKYIAKYGWFTFDGEKQQGWYFLSVDDRTILLLKDVDLTEVTKDSIKITISELRPTLKDMDTPNPVNNYLVIPDTNIRLYDGDIIKISNRPRLKWVVHLGWFIYQEVQNFGWYFESIKNGEILPASVIDLTLCTLVTAKTQGSETYDGKVVNYTRPFTVADAVTLNRTFITLETIEQRDNLDKKKLVNGRLVRVNDVGGVPAYYSWNSETKSWEKADFGGSGEGGIPEVVGTTEHPIILSQLEPGLYRVKGTYKISPSHATTYLTAIDHLAFVAEGEDVNIKVITEHNITDYIVKGDGVIFVNNYATVTYVEETYATKVYVDNKIAVIEAEISEIISEFPDKVRAIVYEVLGEALNGIEEEYIDNLFN